jgi:hypothetical protein
MRTVVATAALLSALSLAHAAPAAAQDRGPERQANSAIEGRARREPRTAMPPERTAPAPIAASRASGDDGQRRGAVRRPPSGGAGQAGGERPNGEGPRTVDRGVPRSSVPNRPNRVYVYPNYYRSYPFYYDPWGYSGFGLNSFYYSPWGWYPNYAYGYGAPYAYGGYAGPGYRGYDRGGVKLKVKPRDAEVYVDGYYAGTVDDFDGTLQSLKLDSGGYRIEIRKPGFETLHFDVRVQPDRTVTFKEEMKPIP